MIEVSVVVPVRDQERFIGRCLDSILEQKTSFPIEILVGDDCSTDNTRKILAEYAAKNDNIKLFLRETQLGATQNVVDLCTKMQGKFFAYLEGDDYWCDPDKLQIQYNFLTTHPDFVGCFHDVLLVDEHDRPIRKKLNWITSKKTLTFDDYDGYHLPGHSSCWVRKNLYAIDPNPFSFIAEAHDSIGDRTSALCFLSFGNFGKVDGAMSCYRYMRESGKNNLTARLYPRHVNCAMTESDILDKMERFCSDVLLRPKSFEKRRREIASYSLLYFLRHPSKENRNVLRQAYSRVRNKPLFWITMPFVSVKLVFNTIQKA